MIYPKFVRVCEIIQIFGTGGLVAVPSYAELDGPAAADVATYFQAANADASTRIKLFHLAFDPAVSSFSGRQQLYERYYSGDAVRVTGILYGLDDKDTPHRPDHRNARRSQGKRALMPAAGGAAEDAELGAMRMVELHGIARRLAGSGRGRIAGRKASKVQATTVGWAAPLCFTTMRAVAHMTSAGDLLRMPQHASVISGTSTLASISGKIISATGSSASSSMPSSANSRAKPRRSAASGSPDR